VFFVVLITNLWVYNKSLYYMPVLNSVLQCAHFRNTTVNAKSIPIKYRTVGKLRFSTIGSGSLQKKNLSNR